jgi:hypothetical protein
VNRAGRGAVAWVPMSAESPRQPVPCTLAELDRAFECPACGALPDRRCRKIARNRVHFARRLRALLATVGARRAGALVLTDIN